MANYLFIGEQYLKDKTALSNNLDIELIVPNIEYSQDAFIQNFLGSKFYNSLQEKYNLQTLNSDEIALINYIKPALAYRSAENSIPFISIQIRNKGLNKFNSENANQSDNSDMKYLRETLISRAEFYEKRLIDFLLVNGNKFEDYSSSSEMLQPNKNSPFDCDLYLNNSFNYCYKCQSYNSKCSC